MIGFSLRLFYTLVFPLLSILFAYSRKLFDFLSPLSRGVTLKLVNKWVDMLIWKKVLKIKPGDKKHWIYIKNKEKINEK